MAHHANIRTKAYVVDHKGAPFVLRDVILDGVREGEALVEIKYSGICHTDIVVQKGGMPTGGYPVVLGHEAVGVVLQVGSDMHVAPGNTVILSFNTCRECRSCLVGELGACVHMTETNFINTARPSPDSRSPISLPDGTPVHGQFFGQSSMSKMAIVTAKSIVKVDAQPNDFTFLAPLSCGYLTGAGTVLNVLKPEPHDSIAVFGLGAVGISAMMAAKALGVQHIIAVDIVDSKLQLARSLGATHIINTSSCHDINSELRAILPHGINKIVDTTGVVAVINSSFKALAHRGTLALLGIPSPSAELQINALDLLTSCKQVIGVIEAFSDPQILIPQLLRLYYEGKFPIDKVAKVYPAEHLGQAIEDLISGSIVKPILCWDGITSPL